MLPYISALCSEPSAKIVSYESGQEALQALQDTQVELVVIGRKAKSQEISSKILSTQLDENATTLVKSINSDEKEEYVLPWKDLDYEKVELVVLTDELGNKVAEHRTPFLYYSNQLDENQLEEILTQIKESL